MDLDQVLSCVADLHHCSQVQLASPAVYLHASCPSIVTGLSYSVHTKGGASAATGEHINIQDPHNYQ